MIIKEEIIRLERRSFLVYFFQLLVSLIILCSAFFFMIPLFHFGWWGIAIFWFLIILSFFYGLLILISWRNNKLIMTRNQVVAVLQIGFFSQKILKINYGKISNVNVLFRGLFSIIFRLGTIEISLVGENEPIYFSGFRQAGAIQELILRLQAELKSGEEEFTKKLTPSQLIELARSLRQKLGSDIFRKIAEEGD